MVSPILLVDHLASPKVPEGPGSHAHKHACGSGVEFRETAPAGHQGAEGQPRLSRVQRSLAP